MSMPPPIHKNDTDRLLNADTMSGAWKWLVFSCVFALFGVVGVLTGYSSATMNTFIIGCAIVGIIRVLNWLSRLRHHIGRSEQILWLCTPMTADEILDHQEIDNPIALTAIKAMTIKDVRGRASSHESILNCLKRSLISELSAVTLIAKTLPAMGLVGTCVGMIGMLDAISVGAEDVTDIEAVSRSIGDALPSMAIAISTTLSAAFFGSVLLFGLVVHAKQKVDQFVDDLDAQLDMFPIHNQSGKTDA